MTERLRALQVIEKDQKPQLFNMEDDGPQTFSLKPNYIIGKTLETATLGKFQLT